MGTEEKTDNQYFFERFSTRLKEERNRHHWSQTELARRMGYSRVMVTNVEGCKQRPSSDFAIRADQALGTGSLFATLRPGNSDERTQRLRRYVTIEQTEAVELYGWQVNVVPGLLQTPDYAREVLTVSIPPWSTDEVARFATSQMNRQQALTRPDNPLTAHFVIGEGALTQLVGATAVMIPQWERLIEWSKRRSVTWQVLPRSVGAHPAMQGSYTILDTASLRAALYVETMASGEVITAEQSVSHARQRFHWLMARAYSPRDSVAFVEQLIKDEGRTP